LHQEAKDSAEGYNSTQDTEMQAKQPLEQKLWGGKGMLESLNTAINLKEQQLSAKTQETEQCWSELAETLHLLLSMHKVEQGSPQDISLKSNPVVQFKVGICQLPQSAVASVNQMPFGQNLNAERSNRVCITWEPMEQEKSEIEELKQEILDITCKAVNTGGKGREKKGMSVAETKQMLCSFVCISDASQVHITKSALSELTLQQQEQSQRRVLEEFGQEGEKEREGKQTQGCLGVMVELVDKARELQELVIQCTKSE
jgi:hypothetical protein